MRSYRKLSLTNVALLLSLLVMVSIFLRLRTESNQGTGSPLKVEEMYKRTEHMRETCSHMPPGRHLRAKVSAKRLYYLAEKYALSYCKVQESGSTFWTQAFLTLAGVNPQWHDYGNVQTMFEVSKAEAANAMKRRASLTMSHDDERVYKTMSFVFARNPYSRLFAAYIHSIYLPHRWYAASKMVTEGPRRECGIDISFNEFLTHVSNNLLKRRFSDSNWAPIFTLCSPCESNIDIIAKVESFSEDTDFILGYANVEDSIREMITDASLRKHSKDDVVAEIHDNVAKGHSVNRGCISEENLAERIWTAFQIKGYIHNDLKFPKATFKSVFRDELRDVLTDAVVTAMDDKPLTDEERIKQMHDWKISFWKSVMEETIHNVQAAYYEDFVLFGYDIDPNSM
ncbi:hypothetical protein ACF0H5_011557 [Mactra antiquata]